MKNPIKKEVLLILEDYDAIRNVLGRYFDNSGYDVISTGSLENALRLGKEEHPEIIVFDSHMHIEDQYKAVTLLHIAMPDCAIVVMNGEDEKERDKMLRLGVQAVFKRSYDRADFEKAISSIKELHHSSIAA